MSDSDTILERVREFIERENLILPGQRVLVAASGGLDSTVLAHMLDRLGYPVALAHVNYGLRGDASDADEEAVADLARSLGCPHHRIRCPLPTPLPADFSLQVWARSERYWHFKKILDEYSYELLVTAHHLEDNLETLLSHLIRGMGPTGARGIPVRSDTPLPLARPLLETTRAEVLQYARSHNLPWREDASNATDAYQRNRLRHHVLPALRDEGLGYDSLRHTFRNLRSAERLNAQSLSTHPAVERHADQIILQRARLPHHPDDCLSLVWHFAGPRGFTREQCRQLVTTERNLTLKSPSFEARADASLIAIRQFSPSDREIRSVEELPVAVVYQGETYFFQRVLVGAPPAPDEVLRCRLPAFPLHLRPRQPSDRIRLPGMGGHRKKIKDLLIDAKVPAWDREQIPLLLDAHGDIVAVIGLRLAQSVALTGDEVEVLTVRRQKKSPGKEDLSGA